MATKALVKTSIDLSIDKTSDSALIVRIVGATMNNDAKSLMKIVNVKDQKDVIVFCALVGIFHVAVISGHENLHDIFDLEHYDDPYEKIADLIKNFKAILEKNSYQTYPIPVMPESKIDKRAFLRKTWDDLFSLFLGESLRRREKDEKYQITETVSKILWIASKYDLFDGDQFLNETVKRVANEKLDHHYVYTFSNSVNKIWDAGRAAWEYFFRKLIVCNQSLPKKVRDSVQKRWDAWFLLEDNYKREKKPIKRDRLLKELKESLKLLK